MVTTRGKVLQILDTEPAALPVTQPTRIERVVDLAAARKPGICILRSRRVRADEVIQ